MKRKRNTKRKRGKLVTWTPCRKYKVGGIVFVLGKPNVITATGKAK